MTAPRQRTAYNRYTYGEKTPTTRKAKAAYMREKRAEARRLREAAEARGEVYTAEGIKHGYTGYVDYQCRCRACCAAKSAVMAREPKRPRRSGISVDGARHANAVP